MAEKSLSPKPRARAVLNASRAAAATGIGTFAVLAASRVIDAILAADVTAPPKQRHTAQRIFERLQTEHGFAGGYTVVKDYVRIAKGRSRETFVPLAHPPGHAQVD